MSETTAENTPIEDESQFPSSRYGWYVVALLTIAYIMSFIDRQILGLLIEPIKADFELTDTQIGLLVGPAFAIFYATMGIPLGWLADNMKRRTLLGFGIFVWSAATAASGFAKSFAGLFIARVSVGAGEATLSPCAISMISDMFPERKRARAIAVYSTALSLASAIAYFGGGTLLAWVGTLDLSEYGFLGQMRPWQIVFLIVGTPGIFLSFLFFMIKEPKRLTNLKNDQETVSIFTTLAHYRHNWQAFVAISFLVGVMTITAYSQFFSAAMFQRTYGWDASTFGIYNGLLLLAFGPASVMFAGWLIDKQVEKGVADGGFRVLRIGLFIMVPFSAAFPLMPNAWTALIVSCGSTVGIAIMSAGGVPAMLKIIPSRIRGQSIAVYYMIISMCGLLLGPTTVGLINDKVFQDESMLNYSMALVPLIFGGIAIILMPLIRKAYHHQLNQDNEI